MDWRLSCNCGADRGTTRIEVREHTRRGKQRRCCDLTNCKWAVCIICGEENEPDRIIGLYIVGQM